MELVQRITGIYLYEWKDSIIPPEPFSKKSKHLPDKRASNALAHSNNSKGGLGSVDMNKVNRSVKIPINECSVSFKLLDEVRESERRG